MCGIAGVVSARTDEQESVVDDQLRLLRHRGPDAAGRFTGGSGMIAQNRLAVIDIATGDPPITNEDATVGAVLNGEIYNFKALRQRLLSRGHTLRSRGDTEV